MIDVLAAGDLGDAAALSAAFGWPHRAADWVFFQSLGHGLAWREDGRLLGTILWFPLGADHAAIGLVQVAPDRQGQGIGRRLMRAAMLAARPRSLLLHATLAGAGLYESLGFAAGGTVQQWQGHYTGAPSHAPGIRRATEADMAAILRLDAAATGIDRRAVVSACAEDVVVTGDVSGYAMRRRFGRGQLIGPVIAGDEAIAIALVGSLCEPGFLRMDVSAEAPRLTAFLAENGFASAGDVLAMTTGFWPVGRDITRFGLASQAIG